MAKKTAQEPEVPTVEEAPVTDPAPEVETSNDVPTVEETPVSDPVPEMETSTDAPTVEEAPVTDPVPVPDPETSADVPTVEENDLIESFENFEETHDDEVKPLSNREAARLLREKHQG